jgi:hypothetical protein
VHLRDGDIWGGWYSRPEFDNVLQAMEQPRFTETTKVIASASGAVITAVLSLLRLRFTGFPLSPLGYAMTCCFGDVLWAPFLLVWGLKSLALRYGGMGYYRQTIPFFLGFALGHLAIAGIFWGIVGALNSQATQGYPVFFG